MTKEDQPIEEAEQPPNTPLAFAGGWQGLDLVGQEEEQQNEEIGTASQSEKGSQAGCFDRAFLRFPRTFNILFKIIVPLLVLIFFSFIFGAGLARLEWKEESKALDSVISNFADLTFRVDQLANQTKSAPELCLESFFFEEDFNRTALQQHMKECGQRLQREEESSATRDYLRTYFGSQEFDSLSFNWVTCADDAITLPNKANQATFVLNRWNASYQSLLVEYQSQNLSLTEAHERARTEATGTDECDVNHSAGALFWFTIMTTIGYGNTAPETNGGRLLVYTLGFFSILLFTALVGQAGSICVLIFDDFFVRCRLPSLTKGIISVAFWLIFLLLWMLAIAGIFIRWARDRTDGTFPLQDAYWFTFISTTTVGLGDIYIPHEYFKPVDMFYIPLIFLLAFVLLATFLLKFSVLVVAWYPKKTGPTFATILEQSRSTETSTSREKSRSSLPQDMLSQEAEVSKDGSRRVDVEGSNSRTFMGAQ